jgi:cytochrome c553
VKTFKNTLLSMALLILPLSSALADGADVYGKCVSCHGDNGMGTDKAPRLAGQHDWYIVTSFEKFGNGERKASASAHKGLSGADVTAVAGYLAALKTEAAE